MYVLINNIIYIYIEYGFADNIGYIYMCMCVWVFPICRLEAVSDRTCVQLIGHVFFVCSVERRIVGRVSRVGVGVMNILYKNIYI